MVDVLGHLGMALIWLAPAWLVIDERKTAATFVGVGFWFGMLPDVDLVLSNVIETVRHHGVFHTVLAAGIFAAVLGPIVGWILKKTLGGSEWFSDAAADNAYSLGVVMVFVAGVSHVFADMLSAPDIAQGVEPFWPVYAQTLGIDVVWYNNPWVNWGLFLVGVALNVALYVRATPERTRGVRA
jgi:membrane-bound metal-dependent hydrolase YbcI (DUF457 family)